MSNELELPATKEAFIQPFRDLLEECMKQYDTCPQQWVLAFPDKDGKPCGLVGRAATQGLNSVLSFVNYTDTDRLEFADAAEATSYLDAVGGIWNGYGDAFPVWLMDVLDDYSDELYHVIDYAENRVNLPSENDR